MFKNLPNLKLLRTFEAAARHQSYGLAAQELCISQAAVSQQMRMLEQAIGITLFNRQNKNMVLTKHGKRFYTATFNALNTVQTALNTLRENDLFGSLTITSTVAFTNLWLMPRLSKFANLYPNIQINVVPSPNFEDLANSDIDLAIRFGQTVEQHTPKNYQCEQFGEDKVLPVCAVSLQQQHRFSKASDLLSTWLVSLDKPNPYDWASWFESHGNLDYQTHNKWTYVPSTDMAINAVLNGHGFTLAAEYLCKELIAQNKLCVPINIAHPNTVKRYFVYPTALKSNQRLAAFTAWLKSEMSSTGHDNPTVT